MTVRCLLIGGAAALAVFAQDNVAKHAPAGAATTVAIMQVGPMTGGNVAYFGAESAGSPKVVKGAPFSETITEHKRTLADGNTIDEKQTGALCRDSEGRTRREQTLGPIGPVPAGPNPVQLVFINDPVAGVSYVLDTNRKTAQRLQLPGTVAHAGATTGGSFSIALSTGGGTPRTAAAIAAPVGGAVWVSSSGEKPVEESLGTKAFEGVQAEGTRITTTIPAGQIGNARPIEIVTERWYSPQLQMTVMTSTNDPMMGQTVYRLANISLDEPAPSLFEIPSDYAVTDGPANAKVLVSPAPTK
jgi:hypothetical protein